MAQPARTFAQATDGLQLAFGASAQHDSNVFRLPDTVEPQSIGRPGKSDTVNSGYVGVRLNKAYSLQRFQLDVTKTAYRHEKFTQLDFDALSYRGAWLWHFTPHVSGALSADHSESAVPFSDFVGTQRNVRKTDNRAFSLDGVLHSGWHILLGAGTSKQTSSIPVAAEADFDSTRAEIGWKYLAGSGSSFAFFQRINEGDYLNRAFVPGSAADNGFRERQVEFQTSWVLTGRSTVSGRATWLDRRHPNLVARNFTGWAANAAYAWTPTGKLQVGLTAQRDISASLDPLARYTSRDVFAVAPAWQAAAKVAIRMRLARMHTDYRNGTSTVQGREEDTDLADVGIDWNATRNIALGASVQHEERSANAPGLDYRATITRLTASFTF